MADGYTRKHRGPAAVLGTTTVCLLVHDLLIRRGDGRRTPRAAVARLTTLRGGLHRRPFDNGARWGDGCVVPDREPVRRAEEATMTRGRWAGSIVCALIGLSGLARADGKPGG